MRNLHTLYAKLIERLRGKTVIQGKVVIGGGYPIFRVLPRMVFWGHVSLFWFGIEIVFLRRPS